MEKNLKNKSNEINKNIGNSQTKILTEFLINILDENHKLLLNTELNDFSNYLKKTSITKKKEDIKNLRYDYVYLLNNIKNKYLQYKLIDYNKICNNQTLKNYENIKNISECKNLCNNDLNCKYISYNNVNNNCKLYKKFKLKKSSNYNSYVKKSLLRNDGYNIINRYLMLKNRPIKDKPYYINVLYFISSIIIIICIVNILGRIIITFLKFILCNYYDTCYYPTEILYFSDPLNKYI